MNKGYMNIAHYVKLMRATTMILILSPVLFLQAKDYRGGEYRTIETFLYGRFEARIKSAPFSGTVSSLFTYHELGGAGIQDWNEIDIEFLGRYINRVQFNTITDWQTNHEHSVTLGYNPAVVFHDYAFEWTPWYVAWFVDGVEVYRQQYGHIEQLNRSQKLMMNIWQPDYPDWVGPFNPTNLPIYAYYDWVSYAAYTPGDGTTGTNNGFTPVWHDDFDSWDTDRWQKATHTWNGNNCDFIPENVVFNNGYMVLCMTTPTNTGYSGPALSLNDSLISLPEDMKLSPAYPNPFNANTNLILQNFSQGNATFEIFDTVGKKIYSKAISSNPTGVQTLVWDGKNDSGKTVSSGSYIVMVNAMDQQIIQKVLMLK